MDFPFVKEAISSLFQKSSCDMYPVRPSEAAPRYRGRIVFHPDKCINCMMCERVCSGNAITHEIVKTPEGDDQVTRTFYLGSCNGCDIELVSVLTPRYDAERLGFKLTGTPRHADIVVVTGPVTQQSLNRVLRAIEQVPEPRCIVTMGSCPQSGNVFRGSYAVAGPLSKYVHVDVDVAGCTPKPEAVMDGLVLATKILQEKRRAMK